LRLPTASRDGRTYARLTVGEGRKISDRIDSHWYLDPVLLGLDSAQVNPRTQALYIPGLRPLVGGDLLTVYEGLAGEVRRDQRLKNVEWLLHELIHELLQFSPFGLLQESVAHALYLLLAGLPDDLTISLPEWSISDWPDLTALAARLRRAQDALTKPIVRVQEFAATSTSLLVYRLALDGPQSDEYRAIEQLIASQADPGAWADCRRLDLGRLIKRNDLREYGLAVTVVWGLAAHALDDDAGDCGRLLDDPVGVALPDARLARSLDAIAEAKPQNVEDLLGVATDIGVVRKLATASLIDVFDSPDPGATVDWPDPVGEVGTALGSDLSDGGRHLVSAYRPLGMAVQGSDRMVSLYGLLSELTLTIPLTTLRQWEGRLIPDCQYCFAIPVGMRLQPVLGRHPDELMEALLAGRETELKVGPLRILPASLDIRRVWGYERALQQLTGPGFTLRCECPAGCSGETCLCALVMQSVRRRVTVGRARISQLACLS
jgi:hypothetical protein